MTILNEVKLSRVETIEDLDLSIRSYNCLRNAGICSIAELVKKDDRELPALKNFGRKSLREVKDQLLSILSHQGLVDTQGDKLFFIDLPTVDLTSKEVLRNLNLAVQDLELSTRSRCYLVVAGGIKFVWQLVQLTEPELLNLQHLGRKSLNEIKRIIMHYKPIIPTKNILLNGDSTEAKREEIRAYFHKTFSTFEALHEILAIDDAFYAQPEKLRHPHIFYFGHTATFFINKFILANLIIKRINPAFESMFAIGVDEMSWDDLNDANYNWPSVEEVREYRKKVRTVIDGCITTLPLSLPITWDSPFWAVLMGIEHERIHLETSSVLIRQTDITLIKPHPLFPCFREYDKAPTNELIAVNGGEVSLGVNHATHTMYGWDNEYGTYTATVLPFNASQHLVSNSEFLVFVEAGGYENGDYWNEEGQQWLAYTHAQHPNFWIKNEAGYRYRALAEEMEMPWDWPVDVNYLEAKAFCNFKAKQLGQSTRLPTEDEWVHLRNQIGLKDEPLWEKAPGNINLEYAASSMPVNHFKQGDFYDIIGNVWQWTETPIYGYEGFKVHPLYDDFSTPTFDNRHNLIKGGSWISTGNESNFASRYAFRRHFFQHAGFRYVTSEHTIKTENAVYEEDRMLSQYCEFHYGGEYFSVANYPKAIVDIALRYTQGLPKNSSLDIGCSVGRASFELAKHYAQVTGLDFSARFINLAHRLRTEGKLRYTIADEGELVSYKEVTLKGLGLNESNKNILFLQADACNLKERFKGYDLIIAANLIDRLNAPEKFLSILHRRVNSGGIVIIASPYTWLVEFTEKNAWLGGFKKDGENVTTLAGLHGVLDEHFERIAEPVEVPFVIRETQRKFQHTLSEVTIWRKDS